MEFNEFKEEFYRLYNQYKINWEVYGFLSRDDSVAVPLQRDTANYTRQYSAKAELPEYKIYLIGSDTKVLSTVFELLCAPLIREIASKHGYQVEESPQTIYPDFTLFRL